MRQFVINRKHKCLLMLIANITHNEVLNCRYHILCNDISPLELIQSTEYKTLSIKKNVKKKKKKCCKIPGPISIGCNTV